MTLPRWELRSWAWVRNCSSDRSPRPMNRWPWRSKTSLDPKCLVLRTLGFCEKITRTSLNAPPSALSTPRATAVELPPSPGSE